jgi:hypothetical protein
MAFSEDELNRILDQLERIAIDKWETSLWLANGVDEYRFYLQTPKGANVKITYLQMADPISSLHDSRMFLEIDNMGIYSCNTLFPEKNRCPLASERLINLGKRLAAYDQQQKHLEHRTSVQQLADAIEEKKSHILEKF